MVRIVLLGSLALTMGLTVVASAQQPARALPSGRTLSVSVSAGDVGGVTLDAGDHPLPEARVQLRNVSDGSIVQRTTSDRAGEFVFRRVPPGHYVVEMTIQGGSVVAVSDAVVATGIQPALTFVRVATPRRAFAWWLGSLTSIALSQASSLGVLGASPGVPVSPQ